MVDGDPSRTAACRVFVSASRHSLGWTDWLGCETLRLAGLTKGIPQMRTTQHILSIATCFFVAGGCNEGNNRPHEAKADHRPEAQTISTSVPSTVPQPTELGKQASTAPPAGVSPSDSLRGKVMETMNAGGYSYMLLKTTQGQSWAAARSMAVKVGDEVEVAGMMPMRNFSSPTLKRTFEEILFVSAARVVGGSKATQAVPAAKTVASPSVPAGNPPSGGNDDTATTATLTAAVISDVEPLPGGFTVAQLFTKASELTSKTVRFRGRVVKANRGILGKNWLHIQDGSGSNGTNDITVTSVAGYAPVGSLITVEGTLNTNRDFGAGYSYAVIVEDAQITLETAKTPATP